MLIDLGLVLRAEGDPASAAIAWEKALTLLEPDKDELASQDPIALALLLLDRRAEAEPLVEATRARRNGELGIELRDAVAEKARAAP